MSRNYNSFKFWRFKGNSTIHPYFGCNISFMNITILWVNWSFKDKYARNLTIFSIKQFSGLFIWDSAHTSRLKNFSKYLWPLQSILWYSFTAWTTGSSDCQCQTKIN